MMFLSHKPPKLSFALLLVTILGRQRFNLTSPYNAQSAAQFFTSALAFTELNVQILIGPPTNHACMLDMQLSLLLPRRLSF